MVVPGPNIVVDELISAWEGNDGNFHIDGMPHVTKIPRKSKGSELSTNALQTVKPKSC